MLESPSLPKVEREVGRDVGLPELFEPTIFSGRVNVHASHFIRAIHPKASIPPTRAAIKKVLDAGWWGQVKIHGHRAQIHIPSATNIEVLAYTRQGSLHTKALPEALIDEIRRLFAPTDGWNVIDTEWHKASERIFVFDMLKFNSRLLDSYAYADRYELLPRVFVSPAIGTLPILKTVDQCLEVLERREEHIEGLVFKSPETEGFADTSVVRCVARR